MKHEIKDHETVEAAEKWWKSHPRKIKTLIVFGVIGALLMIFG